MRKFHYSYSSPRAAVQAFLNGQNAGIAAGAKPDAALVTARKAKCPKYMDLTGINPDTDYLVLDVPHGRRGSADIRQWAKHIGARWHSMSKSWRINATRVDAYGLGIINDLCLFSLEVAKSTKIEYLCRLANDRCIVVLDIPFEEKDFAKAQGARWDTGMRKWYFPIRGKINDATFNKTIISFEEKGWVDLDASETFNSDAVGRTTTYMKISRTNVAPGNFTNSNTVNATSPKVLSPLNMDIFAKGVLKEITAIGIDSTVTCMEEYHLVSSLEPTLEWRVQTIKSGGWVRWQVRSAGDISWSSSKTSYLTTADARSLWATIVEDRGATLFSKKEYRPTKALEKLATGIDFDPNSSRMLTTTEVNLYWEHLLRVSNAESKLP